MTEGNDGFLSRWSRRKRAGGATPVVEARAKGPSSGKAEAPPAEAERKEASARTADQTASDLPDVESLDKDSDYTPFMREGVPENLRRQALRKLWRSDPVLAFRDGLDDYDDDYTKLFPKVVSKAVKTAYRMGKGILAPDDKGAEPVAAEGAKPVADDDRTEEAEEAEPAARKGTAVPDKPA